MSPVWTIVFFLATLPFCVLCAAFDLTRMKIPNWVVLGLFTSFLLLGPFALDLPDFGFRLLQTAVVLTIGYVLSTFLGVGGGDGKFAAASAAFVAVGDYGVIRCRWASYRCSRCGFIALWDAYQRWNP